MNAIYAGKWYDIKEKTGSTNRVFLIDTNECTWGKSRAGAVQILRSKGIECGPFIGEYKLMKKLGKPVTCKVCHKYEYIPEVDATRMVLTVMNVEHI